MKPFDINQLKRRREIIRNEFKTFGNVTIYKSKKAFDRYRNICILIYLKNRPTIIANNQLYDSVNPKFNNKNRR